MSKHIIPRFFALDERFLKYGIVSLYSLRENAKSGNTYKIYFLHTDVSAENQDTASMATTSMLLILIQLPTSSLSGTTTQRPLTSGSSSPTCTPSMTRRST